MGSVQVDTYSKEKRLNDNFSYNIEGIKRMLESYYSLKKDISSVEIKIDLDRSLCSELITPFQRISLALIYAFELSMLQTSKLLNCSILHIKNELEYSFDTLEAVMNGYKTKRIKPVKCKSNSFEQWAKEVRSGSINIFDIPGNVNRELLRKLEVEQNDVLAAAKVKPKPQYRKLIGPVNIYDYPYHKTSEAIERPTGKKYNPIRDGYDYFYKQDTNNHVERNLDFNFPANMKNVGTKKTCVKTSNGYRGIKNNVYQ